MTQKLQISIKESSQTQKARERLRKKMESVEKKITSQALEAKTLEIHKWISKNASNRIVVYNKNIGLFDENQNTARMSRNVSSIAEKIQKEILEEGKDSLKILMEISEELKGVLQ